ncbi:MAG: GTPase HflX [Cyclobacteriaceae bacterium]
MFEVETIGGKTERAVLISVANHSQQDYKTQEYLDELAFLTETLGAEVVTQFIQKLDKPDKRTYVGKGKLGEIKEYTHQHEIDTVIFDDELGPSQVRNLEKELKIKIYDRSLLILDIFLKRAQTQQAKIQVELARSQYMLPRLTNLWSHLERQRGGTATRGGSGEKEIETDKRALRDTITKLKKRLKKIDVQQTTQRKGRDQLARVSLVGYTNVGKSTIMQKLSKSDVFAENKLFATVDSTVRKVTLDQMPFLLTDTIGFIRKLPHTLIECFKSTLDEVREADILIHVVDISNPAHQDHIEVVSKTLGELGVADKPTLIVYNKIDQYEVPRVEDEGGNEVKMDKLDWFNESHYSSEGNAVFISALNKGNFTKFKELLAGLVLERHMQIFPNYVNRVYRESENTQ